MARHNDIGREAEDQALAFLCNQGLTLIQRNFRCKPGEIDLILLDNTTLVFAEVRFRSNQNYGLAAESVDPRKQRKIIRAAQFFLQKNPKLADNPARFDVIGISAEKNTSVDWIKNAFDEF